MGEIRPERKGFKDLQPMKIVKNMSVKSLEVEWAKDTIVSSLKSKAGKKEEYKSLEELEKILPKGVILRIPEYRSDKVLESYININVKHLEAEIEGFDICKIDTDGPGDYFKIGKVNVIRKFP